MIVSDARREANRRNAQKSSGPKTEEGKAAARANAWKHGLTATAVPAVGPEAERVRAERIAEWRAIYAPGDGWQTWLVDELVGVSLRLARIGRMAEIQRGVAASRASGNLWVEDRRREVETIAKGMERHPAEVVAKLRLSPQGCDWLIERWAGLARLADASGGRGWTDEQGRLAYDLLGTPAASRSGPIGASIDEDGRLNGYAPDPATLARAEITRLQALRVLVAEADAADRELVATGWSDLPTRDLATLRRYERSAERRLYWLMDQLKLAGLQPQTQPRPAAAPPAPVVPEPQPAGEPNEPIPAPTRDETKPLELEQGDRHRLVPPRSQSPFPRKGGQAPARSSPEPVPFSSTFAQKETALSPAAPAESAGEIAPVPPAPAVRRRPDPAQLARQERQERRNRHRVRQSA